MNDQSKKLVHKLNTLTSKLIDVKQNRSKSLMHTMKGLTTKNVFDTLIPYDCVNDDTVAAPVTLYNPTLLTDPVSYSWI